MARIVGKGQPVESDPQPKAIDPYQCVCICGKSLDILSVHSKAEYFAV
jgi:hypothetical protein